MLLSKTQEQALAGEGTLIMWPTEVGTLTRFSRSLLLAVLLRL